MTLDAVIFDMDGLLIDSEPLWVASEIEVFARHGLALAPALCARTKGLRVDVVVRSWLAHFASTLDARSLTEELVDAVAARIGAEGMALAGAHDAVRLARALTPHVALASSSPLRVIRAALERLGLQEDFALVRSAEHEAHGKPHPGLFLKVADELGARTTHTTVLEDSLPGVIAAKAARMRCVAVPDASERDDPRFSIADVRLASLTELTAARLSAAPNDSA